MVDSCNRNTRMNVRDPVNRLNTSAHRKMVNTPSILSGSSKDGTGGSILMAIVAGILITIVLVSIIKLFIYLFSNCIKRKNFFDYMFSFDFWVACSVDMGGPEFVEREIKDEREVFHISNQNYTFPEAECKCASYSARLATYPELVEAYNRGLNTCDYGWIEGGQAYYTTQKCFWDKMKHEAEKKGVPLQCGKPGLHGGNFPDDLKFGATCYGIKPAGTVANIKDPDCIERGFCQKPNIEKKTQRLESDEITPFNPDQWSQYKN